MGYRDQPFYNLKDNNGGDGVFQPSTDNGENSPFMFPNKNIRFLAAEEQMRAAVLNSERPVYTPNSYNIQRGYIRGLEQPGVTGGNFSPLKCNFQFNPQQIIQTVSMREDVYLPIMQDPVQFTQPFAGMTNFSFDLMFDRSHEVATARYLNDEGVVSGNGYGAADRDNLNYRRDVRDIGALSDLYLLYSIIGQGFSQEMLTFQASRLKAAGVKAINDAGGADTSDPEAITNSNIDERVNAFINAANIGNSAFLIPNPVRVIFSSMFMIDGFITGTAVDFLKFNNNMVPLLIRVGLTMNAIYLGFAREKTFLTEQLEQQADQIKEQQAADEAAVDEAEAVADTAVDGFGYALATGDGKSVTTDKDRGSRVEYTADYLTGETAVYQWAFKNGGRPDRNWERSLILGTTVRRLSTGDTDNVSTNVDESSNYPRVDETLATCSISVKWWFNLWQADTLDIANKIKSAKGSGYGNNTRGAYAGAFSYSTGDKWKKKKYGYTELPNQSPNAIPHPPKGSTNDSDTWYGSQSSKYYVTKFYVEITVTSASSSTAVSTRTGEHWKVSVGTDHLYSVIPVTWTQGDRPVPGETLRS